MRGRVARSARTAPRASPRSQSIAGERNTEQGFCPPSKHSCPRHRRSRSRGRFHGRAARMRVSTRAWRRTRSSPNVRISIPSTIGRRDDRHTGCPPLPRKQEPVLAGFELTPAAPLDETEEPWRRAHRPARGASFSSGPAARWASARVAAPPRERQHGALASSRGSSRPQAHRGSPQPWVATRTVSGHAGARAGARRTRRPGTAAARTGR